MIRIIHTACAAALVIVALIAHGVKEEKRALDDEAARLAAETVALRAAIARETAEWAHLNSPDSLRRIAEHLYGAGPWSHAAAGGSWRGAESETWRGAVVLRAVAPRQVVDIRTLAYRRLALRDASRAPREAFARTEARP